MPAAVIEPWYEITNRGWGAVLAAAVERNPGGEPIVHHEIRVRFEAFYTRVQELAQGLLLRHRGARPGALRRRMLRATTIRAMPTPRRSGAVDR